MKPERLDKKDKTMISKWMKQNEKRLHALEAQVLNQKSFQPKEAFALTTREPFSERMHDSGQINNHRHSISTPKFEVIS